MNEAIRMQVSAFVDGELPENEAELLVRRLSQDTALRQQVAEYLAIGRLLRGGGYSVAGIDGLRARIAAELDEKPLQEPLEGTHGKESSRLLRPLTGIAVAATVALVAILGLQTVETGDDDLPNPTEVVYTVPPPDELLQMYLSHRETSSDLGASNIHARLVALELREDVLVEAEEEGPATGDDGGSGQVDSRPQ